MFLLRGSQPETNVWKMQPPLTDAELWQRSQGLDQTAIAELYDRHASAAYGLAVHLVGPAAAEDVVHDSFLTLLRNPAAYDPGRGAFRAWLLRVVHNGCVNLLRRRRTTGEEELAFMRDPADQPVDQVIASLASGEVRAALQELSNDQREALVLAYYGGLSHSQLAAKLHVPLGTAKARVRRGLLALRELLSQPTVGEARP
jgi:RNA polymerase sigma-70 factor, ECF subfamily